MSSKRLTCTLNSVVVGLLIHAVIGMTLDITELRLANGTGLYDGRIEILVNGTWGTVCSTSFSWPEARAICNILFGSRSSRTYLTTSSNYGAGTGLIHIDNLDCVGTETDINECSYSFDVACSDHSKDVAVACNVFPLNITSTRLIKGTGLYDGRIEFFVDGIWGTIDRRYVDLYDAQTICNTHNASLAMYFDTSKYGGGTGPILVDDIRCYSKKNDINSCTMYAPYRTRNSHHYDLSIVCTPCGLPDIYNGDPVAFTGNELTVSCQSGFSPNQVKMKCIGNNTWSQEHTCTPNYGYPLNISDIQLNNGHRPSEGRVEIMVNGAWGTICDTNFDSDDATVICNMFGLQYREHYLKATHYSGTGSGPIYVNNLNCTGTESHINQCSYNISNNCTHYDDVAVECTGYQLNFTNLRLAGTSEPYHGRVELEVNGTWGTICQNRFSLFGARVICRMLGLGYKSYFRNTYYGPGSGPIYVDRLYCHSSYRHINDCRYAANNYYNCTHYQDISVMCYDYRLNITEIRLADGPSKAIGRVELMSDDTWGTVCDNTFGMQEADAICSMLGYPSAVTFFTGAHYGSGTGPIFVDALDCDKNASHINDCFYRTDGYCDHDQDVSVVCTDCGDPTPENGFVNSSMTNYGTVVHVTCEVNHNLIGDDDIICQINGSWSNAPICKLIDFGMPKIANGNINTTITTNATVASVWCDIGYKISGDPLLICQPNESWTDYPNCEIIDCGIPKPTNGDINSTITTNVRVASVLCDNGYRLSGDSVIICKPNGSWSKYLHFEIIDCSFPEPNFADVELHDNKTTINKTAIIRCWTGYMPSNKISVTCLSNGTWEIWPECELEGLTSNEKETTNIGTFVGIGVGSAITALLIFSVTKLYIRKKSQRHHRRKHPDNLPDVRTGNDYRMSEQISSTATNNAVYLNEALEAEPDHQNPGL